MKSRISLNKTWKWYVYVIECKDSSFYTGLTWSPSLREDQHSSGLGSKYTKRHGFKKVVYVEEHEDIEVARKREKQIKDWNRKKKLKLISGEWTNQW